MVRAPATNTKRPGERDNSHGGSRFESRGKVGSRFSGGSAGGSSFGGGSRGGERFGGGGDRFGGGGDRFGGGGGRKAVGENSSLAPPDWSSFQLSAFKKDFYTANGVVTQRSQFDVDAFRTEHQITIVGRAPNPIINFDEINMPDYVMNEIRRQGYEKPTPIQAQGTY